MVLFFYRGVFFREVDFFQRGVLKNGAVFFTDGFKKLMLFFTNRSRWCNFCREVHFVRQVPFCRELFVSNCRH